MCKWSDEASRENAVRWSNFGGEVRDDAGDEHSLCGICRYTIYYVDGQKSLNLGLISNENKEGEKFYTAEIC